MYKSRRVFDLFSIQRSDYLHHKKRIDDILYKKALDDKDKQCKLAITMANKIMDIDKAYGRYLVSDEMNAPHLANIFLNRFKELTYTTKDIRREKLMSFFDDFDLD